MYYQIYPLPRESLSHSIVRYVLAWIPFYVLWVLFLLVFTGNTVGQSASSSFTSTLAAAIPGLVVWWLSGKLPWPDRLTASFWMVHAATAIPYALIWAVSAFVVHAIRMNVPLGEAIASSEIFSWRILMGVWLYAIVAGVSYAVRNRERLREQERIAARAEALALEARLSALRAQLNPHFLFNALHTVSALIESNPGKAERAVEELADLLRYVLDEGSESMVSLEDEWAFTKGYLELQGIRLGERLRYKTEFGPATLSCLVPPFALQPLVENAVEHGISTSVSGGEVRIGATLDNGWLVLQVEDDGSTGMRMPPTGTNGHGTGLSVLRERLAAHFGERATLDIERTDGGHRATIRIPT